MCVLNGNSTAMSNAKAAGPARCIRSLPYKSNVKYAAHSTGAASNT
jgi:hypothetical protein